MFEIANVLRFGNGLNDARKQEDTTELYIYAFFIHGILTIQSFVLLNNYERKTNKMNINSFNSSTSQWAIKQSNFLFTSLELPG